MRRLDRHGLCNGSADVVPEAACPVDAKQVEQNQQPIRVRLDVQWQRSWRIAAAVAEQVEYDQPPSFRQQWHQLLPQVRRRREAMDQDERLTSAPGSRGEVIESGPTDVEKLPAH